MYSLEIKGSCSESIRKKCRKNNELRKAIDRKIAWLLENPYAAKPLRTPLQGKFGVHILDCFVPIYEIDEKNKTICLLKFAHHDEAY